jgi:glycosyltransferase involved in cell wall biosynthesis
MKTEPRVFYFCAINSPGYEKKLKQRLHVGAASNKVLSVVSALRSVGCRAYAVSLPVLGRASNSRAVQGDVIRERGAPVVYLSVAADPVLRRLLGAMGFAGFCRRFIKKTDRVLIYNFMPEYLPALLLLRLKGNSAVLDLEDGPLNKCSSWREIGNLMTYKLVRFLCRRGGVTVSLQVAQNHGLQPACVVYGAVRQMNIPMSRPSPDEGSFRILYGGSLCEDTGLNLFCDAVRLIRERMDYRDGALVFVVTGFGGEGLIERLRAQIDDERVSVERKTNLSMEQYQQELASCDAALCLKLPGSGMGDTTFPSKVVEITAAGRLLISTRASDIPLLFDDRNALLLDEATPEALCSAILWALDHPEECAIRARRGRERAMELFSEVAVGQRIQDFIFR